MYTLQGQSNTFTLSLRNHAAVAHAEWELALSWSNNYRLPMKDIILMAVYYLWTIPICTSMSMVHTYASHPCCLLCCCMTDISQYYVWYKFALRNVIYLFVWHFSHEIWHEVISHDPALLAKTEMHVLFPNMIPWPINNSHAVREVTKSQPPPSPQSSNTTYTRSHSLVFWSPAHAEHQSSQLQSTLHPVDLRLVCSLPRTVLGSLVRLTCLYSPSSFLTILLSYSSDSPTLIPLVPGLLSFSKPAKTDSHYSPKLSKDWF